MTLDPGFSDEVTGLGDALRDARLGRALSLDECQRATRISQRYLQALEEEDFGALPAPVFARGFLRSYAQFLGLDPVMLLQRFPAQRPLRDTLPGSDFSNSSQRRSRDDVQGNSERNIISRGDGALSFDEAFGSIGAGVDEEKLSAIPNIDTRSSNVRLGPWLVAAFVVLVVVAGVVAIVTLRDEESAGVAVSSSAPGINEELILEEQKTLPASLERTIDVMPDLKTGTISSASVLLRRSGLPFVLIEIFDELAIQGTILDQLPPAGTALDVNSTVTLIISNGPAPDSFILTSELNGNESIESSLDLSQQSQTDFPDGTEAKDGEAVQP